MSNKESLTHENERLLKRKALDERSREHATGEAQTDMNQSALVQMQQMHGNAFVQRMLAQRPSLVQRASIKQGRDSDRVESEASEKVAASSIYTTQSQAKISRNGTLRIDVGNAVDMRRYSATAKAHRNVVREWLGSAQIQVNDHQFSAENVSLQGDGKLDLNLGETFVQALGQITQGKAQGQTAALDFSRSFNANVEASLHYRSQDSQLQDMDVPNKDALLGGDQNRKQFFMKLKITSVYVVSAEKEREEKQIEGSVLLVGSEKPV